MPRANTLRQSLKIIGERARGYCVYPQHSPTPFSDTLNPQDSGEVMPTRLRDYGMGAQIVLDLGLHEIELLSDTPRTVVALDGYDLKISGQRPILGD